MASVSNDIANGIVSILANVTWSPVPAAGNFTPISRKILTPSGDETQVMVVAQGDGEEVEVAWAGKVFVKYPFSVAIGIKSSAKLADVSDLRSWRQQVRRALDNATMSGVATVNNVFPRGRAQWDKGALSKDWVWSVYSFVVESLEDRQ